MSRPLPIAFLLIIAGIIFANYVSVPLIMLVVAVFILLTVLLSLKSREKRLFYILLGCFVFICGIGLHINFNRLTPDHISYLSESDQNIYYIRATIVSLPEYIWSKWGQRNASFLVKSHSYKSSDSWIRLSGLSKVKIQDCEIDYSYGDTLIFLAAIKKPNRARNPGEFDYRQYLQRKKIHTILDIRSDRDATVIKQASVYSAKRYIFYVREKTQSLIRRNFSSYDAALLNAMLIGSRSNMPKHIKELFIKTQTAHILSISGLHIAIISAIIFFILKLIRIPRKIAAGLLISILIFYAVFAGARTPVVRAVIMISVYLLGYLLERDFDIYSSLSLAGIFILLLNPMQIFDAGFILSFTCVVSIVCLTPMIYKSLNLVVKNRILQYILNLAIGSTAIWIGILPLTIYYFNIVSPIAILANIIVIPLLGIMLSLGFLFLVLGGPIKFAAITLSVFLHFIISIFLKIITVLSQIPFAFTYLADISIFTIALYYLFLAIFIYRDRLKISFARFCMAVLIIFNIFVWCDFINVDDNFGRTFFDFKDGDNRDACRR
ncbi:ComEC/Rec2 family competence protein [Candidatus Omnitrophota bacterium]